MIWATGFALDHSWIDAPIFGVDGAVKHERGVTESPGLYFLGMPWQHTRGSALLGWVKDDAATSPPRSRRRPAPTTPSRSPADQAHSAPNQRNPHMSHSTRHFIRHYIEMVVVMFAGMIVLGLPGEAGLNALGTSTSELHDSAPALVFLGMAFTMTAPMVAWMRFRGHAWQPCLEMAASMVIPTLIAIVLLWAGVMGFGALMGLEHVAMLLGMLVAMLLRPEEYTHHGHAHHAAPQEATA